MFLRYFELIFNSLEEIEKRFQEKPEETQKEKLVHDVLKLRNTMDQCLKYWLSFEKRINALQQEYGFILPDVLPDGFLEEIKKNDEIESKNVDSDEQNKQNNYTFVKLESEEGINSFRKGLGFWDLAMLEEAIKEFEKVVQLEPNFIFGHFCLGLAYSQKGLYNKAFRKLRLVKALSRDSSLNAFVHNAIGNIYAEEKEYYQALGEFMKAVEEDPYFSIAYYNMGAVYFNLRRYEEAISAFEKVKETSMDWEVCYYLGKAYAITGELTKSLQNYKDALSLNSTEPKILFDMGVLYDLLGDKKNATYCYSRIINSTS
jgi:tetratricopeptide (TPR) repeat protein